MKKIKRQVHSSNFKKKVALEALKSEDTASAIAKKYSINVNLVSKWKKQLLDNAEKAFDSNQTISTDQKDKIEEPLFTKIGELQYQIDWLKKKLQIF